MPSYATYQNRACIFVQDRNIILGVTDSLIENLQSGIKTLRIQKGVSQEKMALDLDIDQSQLSKLERGQQKLSEKLAMRFADYFDDVIAESGTLIVPPDV